MVEGLSSSQRSRRREFELHMITIKDSTGRSVDRDHSLLVIDETIAPVNDTLTVKNEINENRYVLSPKGS